VRAPFKRVGIVVLDSVGIGEAPDAAAFGDTGSATLPHIAEVVAGFSLPNLAELGLGRIVQLEGVPAAASPRGAFGSMSPVAAGKDTTSGHWEISGLILENPFPTFPDGFPPRIVSQFEERIGSKILGNKAASGTEIIAELGAEHMETGRPIVYTSGDSVFQIATHEDVVSRERLYEMCRIARGMLIGGDQVGRVIARPFEGEPGAFKRTSGRKDFSVDPPGETMLDAVSGAGLEVHAIGKISNIFAGRGVTRSTPTKSNDEGVTATIEAFQGSSGGLAFTNLVDFDEAYGHRNDPEGYGRALEAFDARLPELIAALGPNDILFVTADHGNDPTTSSTDHSRERVPVLAVGERVTPGTDIGTRRTFADLGATVIELLDVAGSTSGTSFAKDILR
jgi:phosphopentomutase